MARVKLPTILRSRADGQAQVEARGETLRELLADLEVQFPGITTTIVTEDGALHRFVNVYVNDEDVRFAGGMDAPVADGDTMTILPAVAGGAAA
jgi:molybdopterin converting factor small subunit